MHVSLRGSNNVSNACKSFQRDTGVKEYRRALSSQPCERLKGQPCLALVTVNVHLINKCSDTQTLNETQQQQQLLVIQPHRCKSLDGRRLGVSHHSRTYMCFFFPLLVRLCVFVCCWRGGGVKSRKWHRGGLLLLLFFFFCCCCCCCSQRNRWKKCETYSSGCRRSASSLCSQ